MKTWQKLLHITFGIALVNIITADIVEALELTPQRNLEVRFEDLPNIVSGSGGIRLESGAENFDLNDSGEFFDLELDGINVGRFGCYVESGITNLLGDTSEEGCSFSQYLSFVDDFGNDLIANLINDDGRLSVNAIFSDNVELPNNTLIVTVYGAFSTSTPVVPTPAVVLPVLSSLFASSYRKSKKNN